ncbi:hypothetical protein [Bradyrhizobium sp.]|uniref:hypothetical protein n=1 Tax=Bradyrhizobium sp. TaxID=376 RepID=UPI00238EFD69|nr:hypothetical protein [Bradyrhizobium sp.]MDE2380338.1 hypothetical protein [Bradyrhizobium sp.]
MAQPLLSTHPISDNARPNRAASALLLAGAGLAALALIGTAALWFHYGTQVFFETIRAGLAACF